MKKIVIVLALMFQVNALAFQGQENEGTAVCKGSSFTCASENEKIVSCTFANSIYVGIANESSHSFVAKQVPSKSGVLGAPVIFRGPKVNLSICTDCSGKDGMPGELTAKLIGLENVKMTCKKN